MNHIGLFEGIGGFSIAARWMGWKTIAWCEVDPFCQRVLKYHFPDAKGHSDIRETDFTGYRGQCDILQGTNRAWMDRTEQPAKHTNSNAYDKRLEGRKIIGESAGKRTESNKQSDGLLRTNWQDFPTQSPLCTRDDGLSLGLVDITFSKWRRESIKALGNPVVPALVYEIFKAIEQTLLNTTMGKK